jgi:hypothetical protein
LRYLILGNRKGKIMKNELPDWVLCHKSQGREIKKIQDKYYLYEVSSYYDKCY